MINILPELEITQENVDVLIESLKGQKKIVLEIGFGGGENLLNLIKADKESYYIGCEPYLNGLTNFLIKLDTKDYERVKVFKEDVRNLLLYVPNCFFDNIFILFPDPWPKERHRKRKMINKENAKLIIDKLKNKGKIYLATDVEKYFFEMLDVFNRLKNIYIINKENFKLRPDSIVSTRYEKKAIEKNSQPFFLVIKKNLD
jgi:release factor glutamine methyltransferase